MGIDFTYDFYVHRQYAGRFLTAVAELCDPQKSRWTNVLLPDGTSVRLPGTRGFVSDKTVALADEGDFDLSLCFPVDEPLRAYQDETDPARACCGRPVATPRRRSRSCRCGWPASPWARRNGSSGRSIRSSRPTSTTSPTTRGCHCTAGSARDQDREGR